MKRINEMISIGIFYKTEKFKKKIIGSILKDYTNKYISIINENEITYQNGTSIIFINVDNHETKGYKFDRVVTEYENFDNVTDSYVDNYIKPFMFFDVNWKHKKVFDNIDERGNKRNE